MLIESGYAKLPSINDYNGSKKVTMNFTSALAGSGKPQNGLHQGCFPTDLAVLQCIGSELIYPG